MKKIIHKLKKNRLVSKIAALLTICMILVSSFTVSSFAADEEEATNSLIDVWTGVTDSIMSLLGTAQGVFFTQTGGSNSIVFNSSDLIEIDDGTDLAYYVKLTGFDPSSAVPGQSYPFQIFGEVYNLTFTSVGGVYMFIGTGSTVPFGIVLIPDLPEFSQFPLEAESWYLQLVEPFSGSITLASPFSFGAGFSLTFLGTLVVIGVAIALIMLLVYVISRFLRLRG